MGIHQNKISVGGKDYMFYTFTGRKSWKIFRKLVNIIGPSWTAVEEQGLEAALSQFFYSLDDDGLDNLMEEVFSGVMDGMGQELDIDSHFQGRTKDMLIVFIQIIKVNYADFFTGNGISDIINQLVPKAQS